MKIVIWDDETIFQISDEEFEKVNELIEAHANSWGDFSNPGGATIQLFTKEDVDELVGDDEDDSDESSD